MRNFLIAAILALCVYGAVKHHSEQNKEQSAASASSAAAEKQTKLIRYKDTDGTDRLIGPTGKPAVVGFWIADCGYSAHALYLLTQIRKQYPEDQLDVVGFYMNNISKSALADLVKQHAYGFEYNCTITAAQPPVERIAKLADTFKFHAPGRDLYIVDREGKIKSVGISDMREKNDIVLERLNAAIKNVIAS